MAITENKEGYLVLARKYRPKQLSELIGQDVFTKTISNAILTNKLHHAFLLTGTRGTGKTSSARILALSINCKASDKETITPCLKCDTCQATLTGSNPDVVEFDAASNTGVDKMREMIENCTFIPIMSRYKVYIIDEVHMLSKSAFNALLKTLEEPPEKVKFIFATTEVNKVPITILSRCQKFYFKNISPEIIFPHLGDICKKENIRYDDESLQLIAKYANGSMRDALSLLDQAISISSDNNIKIDVIKSMLAIPDREIVSRLFYNCYIGNIVEAMKNSSELISNDINITHIISELMEIILDGLKVTSQVTDISSIDHEFADIFKKLINDNILNVPRLLRMWQVLSLSLQEIKTIQVRQYFVAVIYKLCYTSTLPTPIEALKLIKDEKLQEVMTNFPNGKIIK